MLFIRHNCFFIIFPYILGYCWEICQWEWSTLPKTAKFCFNYPLLVYLQWNSKTFVECYWCNNKQVSQFSCCSHSKGNSLLILFNADFKEWVPKIQAQNLSMRNLSTKILSTRFLSITEFWVLKQRADSEPFVKKKDEEEGHEKGEKEGVHGSNLGHRSRAF